MESTVTGLAHKHCMGTVGLVGSRADGTFRDGSDVDIFVTDFSDAFGDELAQLLSLPVHLHNINRIPWTDPRHLCVKWLNVVRLPKVPVPRGSVLTRLNGKAIRQPAKMIPHFIEVDGPVITGGHAPSRMYFPPPMGWSHVQQPPVLADRINPRYGTIVFSRRSVKPINDTELAVAKLATQLASRWHRVVVVTDKESENLFQDSGFRYDELLPVLRFPYTHAWSAGKIEACLVMTSFGAPFVHADLDVLLWKPLPSRAFEAPVFAEKRDYCSSLGVEAFISRYFDSPLSPRPCIHQFNCGVFGGSDLIGLARWAYRSLEWSRQHRGFPDEDSNWASMIIEQAALWDSFPEADTLYSTEWPSFEEQFTVGYSHLTGGSKRTVAAQRMIDMVGSNADHA